MLKLQNVLLPSARTCHETQLYFRCDKTQAPECSEDGQSLMIPKDTAVSFDTYFGGFSIEKWRKYTHVNTISLTLRLTGAFRVTLLCKIREPNKDIREQQFAEEICRTQPGVTEEFTFEFPEQPAEGMYCFALESMEENSLFCGGYYGAALEPAQIRQVKLAIGVCTFRREEFVAKNLQHLKECFLENPDSFLYDKLEVFISDNAGTLDIPALSSDKIHIVKNKNVGGAGGFTRCMLEIQDVRAEKGITHILLNDDDIVYEPEAIFRTCTFLSCLTEEYREAFIGGAMLRLDKQYFQTEAGAVWNGGRLVSLKHGLDLRRLEACLYNELEEAPEYNAWWFCAFPAEIASEDNLPMPIFIRGDDVEYGLRNTKHLVLLNGICVWHEPFENKYSSSLYYYILRNRLIDNALHDMNMTTEELKKEVYGYVMNEVRLYRYQNARLLLRGVEDFFGGVDWLEHHDGEALHKSIMDEGYKLQPLEMLGEGITFDERLFEESCNIRQPVHLLHRIIANRTVNGTFLKPKYQYNVVPTDGVRQISVFRRETVLNYDAASGRGFVTKRDAEEAKACMKLLKAMYKKIDQHYAKTVEDYARNGSRLWKRSFWEKYLGLQDA